jgi:hypothetical protein
MGLGRQETNKAAVGVPCRVSSFSLHRCLIKLERLARTRRNLTDQIPGQRSYSVPRRIR